MTYNFDPERWYEIQLRLLDKRLEDKEIDQNRHCLERKDLDRRYEEMLSRLDGTYSIPEEPR